MLWLLSNWKILAVLAFIAGLYFFADHNGFTRAQDRCEKDMREAHDKAQKEKDELQREADDAARKYEHDRADSELLLASLTGELDDEKNKNTAFNSCHAGAGFVQLYQRAAAGTGSPSTR